MAGENAIEVDGKIVEALSQRLYRVELANGHRFLAHVGGQGQLAIESLALGAKVSVRMSPYDLSKGRILTAGK